MSSSGGNNSGQMSLHPDMSKSKGTGSGTAVSPKTTSAPPLIHGPDVNSKQAPTSVPSSSISPQSQSSSASHAAGSAPVASAHANTVSSNSSGSSSLPLPSSVPSFTLPPTSKSGPSSLTANASTLTPVSLQSGQGSVYTLSDLYPKPQRVGGNNSMSGPSTSSSGGTNGSSGASAAAAGTTLLSSITGALTRDSGADGDDDDDTPDLSSLAPMTSRFSGITIDSAANDSPKFREQIDRFFTDMEEMAKWLDSVIQDFKGIERDLIKQNEQTLHLRNLIPRDEDEIELIAEYHPILQLLAENLDHASQKRGQYGEEILKNLVTPFQKFLDDDLKEMKRLCVHLISIKESYDRDVRKYASLTKVKEVNNMSEEYHALLNSRKTYKLLAAEWVQKVSNFRATFPSQIFQHILEIMEGQTPNNDGNERNKRIQSLKDAVTKKCQEHVAAGIALKERKKLLEEEIESPARAIAHHLGTANQDRLSIEQPPQLPDDNHKQNASKEGYLFLKQDGKTRNPWKRVYLVLKDGELSYCTYSKKYDRKKHSVLTQHIIHVSLCKLVAVENPERRFCFEVITPRSSFILHAETDDERSDWIKTIDGARTDAVLSLPLEDPPSEKMSTQEDGSNEDAISRGYKSFKYPENHDLAKKNRELHRFIPTIPPTDYVVSSKVHSLQQISANNVNYVKGRVYLTQNRLCFYANNLGQMSKLVLDFKSVTKVDNKDPKLLIISTDEGQYTLKIHEGKDLLELVLTVWKNFHNPTPLGIQELFTALQGISSASATDSSTNLNTVEDTSTVEGGANIATGNEKNATESIPAEDCIAPDVVCPATEVACECAEHPTGAEPRIEIIAAGCDKLFEFMFESDMFQKIHESCGRTGYTRSIWKPNTTPPNTEARLVKMNVPVNVPMVKLDRADAFENQVMLRKVNHLCYVIESINSTPDIPGSSAFTACTRYCLTYVTRHSTKLRTTRFIRWNKEPGFLLKGVVQKIAFAEGFKTCEKVSERLNARFPSKEHAGPRPLAISGAKRLSKSDDVLTSLTTHHRRKSDTRGIYRQLSRLARTWLIFVQYVFMSSTIFGANSPVASRHHRATLSLRRASLVLAFFIVSLLFNLFMLLRSPKSAWPISQTSTNYHPAVEKALYAELDYGHDHWKLVLNSAGDQKDFKGGQFYWESIESRRAQLVDIENELLRKIVYTTGDLGDKELTESFHRFVSERASKPGEKWLIPSAERISAKLATWHADVNEVRGELIRSFQLLSEFEQKLWEAEYVNWMADKVAACWDGLLTDQLAASVVSTSPTPAINTESIKGKSASSSASIQSAHSKAECINLEKLLRTFHARAAKQRST